MKLTHKEAQLVLNEAYRLNSTGDYMVPSENHDNTFQFELLPEENNMDKLTQLQKQLDEAQATIRELQYQLNESNNVQEQEQKWNPIEGEWTIYSDGDIKEGGTVEDFQQFGTERQTEQHAIKARDEMRVFNRLLAYRDEHDPEFEYDIDQSNCYIEYNENNENNGKYEVDWDHSYKRIGLVYMSESVARELADKLNKGIVVL
jgi:TolA-binding protein